jgi:hypothetical protein
MSKDIIFDISGFYSDEDSESWFSVLWHRAVMCLLVPEDGSSMTLRNVGILLPHQYTASQPRKTATWIILRYVPVFAFRSCVRVFVHAKRRTQTKGVWGEYLELGGRKWREAGEHYIMRSFITCTLHKILLGWSNKGWAGHVACMGKMNSYKILV